MKKKKKTKKQLQKQTREFRQRTGRWHGNGMSMQAQRNVRPKGTVI